MSVERTLSIIKPDAVGKNVIGKILQRFEENNLRIVASKMIHLTQEKAEGFYDIHRDKPFFSKFSRIYDFRASYSPSIRGRKCSK